MPRKLTKEEFIENAINVHGDKKYGYPKVVYKGNKKEVDIYCNICEKHFSQTPNNHLDGCGCPICGKNNSIKKHTKDQKQFIKDAIHVHGDKYGYWDVIYRGNKKRVSIWCKKHKKHFPQTPNAHLSGHGCPICRYEKSAKANTKLLEQFIKDAIEVHGDKYGYWDDIYVNDHTNVQIYCKKHKKHFPQTPTAHIHQKQGCPICRESKGEKEVRKILDKNNILYTPQKRYVDCRDVYSLPFDFYLSEYDVCIEYQGAQHYKLVNFGGKLTKEKQQKNFKTTKYHDKIKKDYCTDNNIVLIEIPYQDFKNIESIISNIINTYK